jgi:uncharacterized membrane protein
MFNWLRPNWDIAKTSLWLIPVVMVLAGVALAVAMLQLDAGLGSEDHVRAWWMNGGDGEDARNLLSTLLSAVITMASMVFSVTVVALTLAANSYGSRLVRIFRSDPQTQIVLGTFAATIIYCLLVLRSVEGQAPIEEVPHAAVTVGTALGLLCVLALLGFIHGVGRSIVADEVVRRAASEANAAVVALPEASGEPPEHKPADLPPGFDTGAAKIALPKEGYVQSVDYEGLLAWAEKHDVIVRLDFRPGDFVVDGEQRLLVFPPPADRERARTELGRSIISGTERTPTQDLEFSVRHLVEIAVRALSPGINDPFTATTVVDQMRGVLLRLMSRTLPPETLRDAAGRVRIWRDISTHEGLLDAALHQIRQAAAPHPAVLIHMLRALARIAAQARLDEQRNALKRHADLILAAGERSVDEKADVADIARAHRRAVEACAKPLLI